MSIPTRDLLYAHGLLCSWIFGKMLTKEEADRHCEVINSFQHNLKEHLVEDAPMFEVVRCLRRGYYTVEPTGGWSAISEKKN